MFREADVAGGIDLSTRAQGSTEALDSIQIEEEDHLTAQVGNSVFSISRGHASSVATEVVAEMTGRYYSHNAYYHLSDGALDTSLSPGGYSVSSEEAREIALKHALQETQMELGGQIVPATTVIALSEELRRHAIGASASTTSVSASHESQTGVNNSARSNVITVQQVDTKTTSNPSSNFIYSSSSPSGISSSSLVNGGEDMQTVKLTHNNIDHLELGAIGSNSSYSFTVPSTVDQILVVEPSRDTGDNNFGLAISLAVQNQAKGMAA